MVLTVYSETKFGGTSKVIKDSEVNLTKVGVKFNIKVRKFTRLKEILIQVISSRVSLRIALSVFIPVS